MSYTSLVRWVCRVAFAALIVFDLTGYFQIIDYKVTYTWFGLLITATSVFIGIEVVSYAAWRWRRHDLYWPVWPIALFVVAADGFGDLFHWYERNIPFFGTQLWYDQAMHFVGSMAAAIIMLAFIRAVRSVNHHRELRTEDLLLMLTLSVSVGVLYELEEYFEDLAWGSNRLGDGFDTANDLFLNLCGALVVTLVVAWLRHRSRVRGFQS